MSLALSTTAELISGAQGSRVVRERVAAEVIAFKSSGLSRGADESTFTPRLDVVIVGDRKDSATYVRMKAKACEEVGFLHETHALPADVSQEDLEKLISDLNANPAVNGILIQLPLPANLNTVGVIEKISPEKDVDGLHPMNAGLLFRDGINAPLIPCTPLGCIELLKQYNITVAGKNVVVIGRSNLVGKPVSMLLQGMNATVTMCHSKTANLAAVVGTADIVIAAIGRPLFVQGSWLRHGAVVIDVGINAIDDETKKTGHRLVGDVDFESARAAASFITPVPGGVGPMTVAMLMENTVKAFSLQHASAIIADLRKSVPLATAQALVAAIHTAAVTAEPESDAAASHGALRLSKEFIAKIIGARVIPDTFAHMFLHLLQIDPTADENLNLIVSRIGFADAQ